MTAILLAEFSRARALTAAARGAALRKIRVLDAFTPFPLEAIADLLPTRPSRIRLVMLIGGVAVAALAYGTEIYSAVLNYPYNSGGRPPNSWPAFVLVPFAVGILGAAISGLIAFLSEAGLPRLHHPLFAAEGFERASQDRFLLALSPPEAPDDARLVVAWLREVGAVAVREVDT